VDRFLGTDEPDLRTGANIAGSVDPRTGTAWLIWQDGRFRNDGLNDIVFVGSSDGGLTWTTPRRVNRRGSHRHVDHFTPAVASLADRVVVCYRTRVMSPKSSEFVWMACSSSPNGGRSWGPARRIGAPTDLSHAATLLGGKRFLGDYMGVAVASKSYHPAWCRAAESGWPHARYHQTTWTATGPLPGR
jgi:hypothetical protein